MTRHWGDIAADASHAPTTPGARGGRFDMHFRLHGRRTCLARQFISYPYHFTRPFELDPDIPQLLTLYQQSSSGGLYRGDTLTSELSLATGTAAHVTTQASTIVHDCHGVPARQSLRLSVASDAFLAFTPDPLILFPGAHVDMATDIVTDRSAVVLVQEIFDRHDPRATGGSFERLTAETVVRTTDDAVLLRDRMTVTGGDVAAPGASPAGARRIIGSLLLLGPADRLPPDDALRAAAMGPGLVAGVGALPNEAGLVVRFLANDSHDAQQATARIFELAIQSRFGASPRRRRK